MHMRTTVEDRCFLIRSPGSLIANMPIPPTGRELGHGALSPVLEVGWGQGANVGVSRKHERRKAAWTQPGGVLLGVGVGGTVSDREPLGRVAHVCHWGELPGVCVVGAGGACKG